MFRDIIRNLELLIIDKIFMKKKNLKKQFLVLDFKKKEIKNKTIKSIASYHPNVFAVKGFDCHNYQNLSINQ